MSTHPMTQPPSLELVRHELRMRMLTVREVSRPTPRLVRIALGGDDLAGFRSDGPADHVKLFFPAAGESEPITPELGPDGVVRGDGPEPIARDYTPRHHRLGGDGRERLLEIDFVLHDGGHASAWADRAEVGDRLGVGGPRGSHVPAGDFGALVLVGDETALPAMHNWLRWAPAGLAVTLVAEVEDDAEVQPLDTAAELDARWIRRAGAEDLLAILRVVDLPPGPDTFHWIAGEAAMARSARNILVDDRGIDPARVHSRGYWKRGSADHQEPHAD